MGAAARQEKPLAAIAQSRFESDDGEVFFRPSVDCLQISQPSRAPPERAI